MMSSSSSYSTTTTATLSPDHLPPPPPSPPPSSEQLCYVHCTLCDTVLAVSVPYSSLFMTVTVRCGHCTNLLPVNMRGFLLPPPPSSSSSSSSSSTNQQLQLTHNFFSPNSYNLLEEIPNPNPTFLSNNQRTTNLTDFGLSTGGLLDELPRPPPVINRPPEKRQRVPSAYNRFIKDEIQRIKARNPDISHREAFSAAAKNWAHFPHIQFGLMPGQTVKKTTGQLQEGEDRVLMKDGFFASANVGLSPY